MPPLSPSTALITGASSGLGAEYARQLAGQGYNLILTARRADRLTTLAELLGAEYDVEVETLAADLSLDEGMTAVEQRIASCETLGLLVNNAGFGGERRFAETDPALQIRMLRLHIEAAVRLSRAAVPGMVARHKGAIINVSSVAGFLAGPFNVLYHTTKAFLIDFSRSLQYSLRDSGVRVQACCPGFTHTEFHDELKYFDKSRFPKFMWMDAAPVVAESLRALKGRKVVVVPGLFYRAVVFLATFPPTAALVRAVAARIRR